MVLTSARLAAVNVLRPGSRVRVRAPEPAQGSSHLLGSGATHSAITDTQFLQVPKSLRHRFPRRSEALRRRTETRMFRVTPDTGAGIFGDVLSRVGPKAGSDSERELCGRNAGSVTRSGSHVKVRRASGDTIHPAEEDEERPGACCV